MPISQEKNNPPIIRLSSGTIEALKWLAIIFMTLDHVNRFLLHDSVASMYVIGRLAMPMFAFILAYNLAQPQAIKSGMYLRVMRRLSFFAIISSIPFAGLNNLFQGWLPLNILFTLLVGTGLLLLIESKIKYRHLLAILIFVISGAVIEYWWAGVAVFFFFWRCVRSLSLVNIIGLVASLTLLGNINENQWAFATLPIIYAASFININIPRLKHFLYYYYPLHLSIIWVIRRTFF